jgi:hypothetical protein
MGSETVDPYWIPGEHSIIGTFSQSLFCSSLFYFHRRCLETRKYAGPHQVGSMLKRLCEDDEGYKRYFAWKKSKKKKKQTKSKQNKTSQNKTKQNK